MNMANFIKHNENPKGRKTSDCTTRAIAKATGMPYLDVLAWQYAKAINKGYYLNDTKTTNAILTDPELGFEEVKVVVPRGQGRQTVRQLVDAHPHDRLVISVAGHLTCAVDGCIYDLWDCGYKSVYKYWIKKEG